MFDDEYPDNEQERPEHSLNVPVEVTVAWSNREIVQEATEAVTRAVLGEHKAKLKEKVFARLDELVNEVLEEAINQEVTLTDRWGAPQGAPISVRALLQQSAEEWLTAKVDRYGSPSRHGRDRTRAQYLFEKAIGESLTDRVKKIIVQEVGSLDALIAEEVRRQLRQKIK